MIDDSTCKPVQQSGSGYGFDDDGARVPVVGFDFPESEKEGKQSSADIDPSQKRQLAFELVGEALRGIVSGGHRDAMPTRIAALLVLMGTETNESAAVLAKVQPRTLKRAVDDANAEMRIYAQRNGLEIKGI